MFSDRTGRKEIIWTLVGIGISVALGFSVDEPLLALLLLSWLYLLFTQWNLLRLYRWLREGRKDELPETAGIWRSVFQDIGKMEKRNRKRKRKLSRLLNAFRRSMSALPDATVVLNRQGEAEWWNIAAVGMLGMKRLQHRGHKLDHLIDDHRFSEYLQSADSSASLEVSSPVDSEILLEIRIVPYGKGRRLLQARDITHVRQLEQVRQDFVANASHELRTPLTVISGYLETMMGSRDLRDGPWEAAVEQMCQQAARTRDIVTDMLTLSRLERDSRYEGQQTVSVADLIISIRDEAEVLNAKGELQIETEVMPGYSLKGSYEDIRSIFTNLVSNAVRYTPQKGLIKIGWWVDEQGAYFSVSDTGIGIAPQHIPRLTERFYRVDSARSRENGSTGLGLAIVKHALNHYNGMLYIESEEGRGSTFTCRFPPGSVVKRAA